MLKFCLYVMIIFLITFNLTASISRTGALKFSKALCETTDPEAVTFYKCTLERNSKNIMTFNLALSPPTKNHTNLLLNFSLLRKVNKDFTPFLYETTIDFCNFVKGINTDMFWKGMYKLLMPYTNINHSCPYEHDLIVSNYAIQPEEFKLVLVPRGEYITQYLNKINAVRSGRIEISKITCETFDVAFATFPKCEMSKSNKRMVWSLYAKLHQRIENMTVYAKLFRFVNKKYQSFLYDDKIDFCEFIGNVKRHLLWGLVLDMVLKDSNVNHSCPYEDSLIINNFLLEGKQLKYIPLPRAKYKMEFLLTVDNASKMKFELFCEKT